METSDFGTFEFGDFGGLTDDDAEMAESSAASLGSSGPAVVVVDADVAVRDYLASLLGDATAKAVDLDQVEHQAAGAPTVAVLGPSLADSSSLARVASWRTTKPTIGTVLVVSEVTTEILQTAMRSGVMDVLGAPIDQHALVDSVDRVAQSLRVPVAMPGSVDGPEILEEGERGRVISVFSTKGGSGKSVVATNVAIALARRSSRPVVLVDAHLQFGDVAVMLKMPAERTVADAVDQIDRLDASLLRDLLIEHTSSGLLVLPAPLEPAYAEKVTGEEMAKVVDLLRTFCGHVVVDLPAVFDEKVLAVLETSDDIVLVAGLDIPNIKNVKIGLHTLEMVGVPSDRLHLILNRADSKVKLDVAEVERTLGVGSECRVPSDVVVPISVNKGSPVVLSAPRSGVSRALTEFAVQFLDDSMLRRDDSEAAGRRRFFG